MRCESHIKRQTSSPHVSVTTSPLLGRDQESGDQKAKKPTKIKKSGSKNHPVLWVDLFRCFLCQKEGRSPPLRRCSQCEVAYYCSKTCQWGHWKAHKAACIAAVAAKADRARRQSICPRFVRSTIVPWPPRFRKFSPWPMATPSLHNRAVSFCVPLSPASSSSNYSMNYSTTYRARSWSNEVARPVWPFRSSRLVPVTTTRLLRSGHSLRSFSPSSFSLSVDRACPWADASE